MNSVLKRIKKVVRLAFVAAMICMNLFSVSAKADEAPVSGKIVEIKENVTVYADKSTDSEVIVTFKAGDVMFVTGDTGDGWYTVAYQGKIGYVSKTVSSPSSDGAEGTVSNSTGDANATGTSADNTSINNKEETHELELVDFGEQMQEEIEEEMAQTNIETTYLAEEVVQYQESKTNAIIWVVIISIMAVILIVVGFISYRLRMKGESFSISNIIRRKR